MFNSAKKLCPIDGPPSISAPTSSNKRLFCAHRSLAARDLLPYVEQPLRLATAQPPIRPSFVWADGRNALSFVAWGAVATVEVQQPERFKSAYRRCTELIARPEPIRGDCRPDLPLPLWVGGFSFGGSCSKSASSTAKSADQPWRDWPSGWLWIPQRIVYRHRQYCGLLEYRLGTCPSLNTLQRDFHELEAVAESSSPSRLASRELRLDPGQRERWLALVQRARGALNRGDFEKVVLAWAHTQELNESGVDLTATLADLGRRFGDCTLFALRRREALFFGATPETLLRRHGRIIDTVSLAGTAPRAQDPVTDAAAALALAASIKERREQSVVTKHLIAALDPLCIELMVEAEPTLRQLDNVQHLQTGIRGQLRRPQHILELIERLHPTPAVGGYPTTQATRWIADHEGLQRGYYAAPIGWFDDQGDGHFVVALRSALARDGRVHAYVGAGITERSVAADEWSETTHKLRAVADSLICHNHDA